MNHGSLFSGIGGFDLAARTVGWDNKFFCDIDPFCQTILKHHFPHATPYIDIKKTDFTLWRGKIDIVSGGFPCQPFSQAGKRKGTGDDRHLWPDMLRAVREIRPRWVVGENVLGIVNWNAGMVFEQVCAQLEAEGYAVQPFVLPAAGVGAPHQRYRTWFVAHADGGVDRRSQSRSNDKEKGIQGTQWTQNSTSWEFSGANKFDASCTGSPDGIEWDTPYSEVQRCERGTDDDREENTAARRRNIRSRPSGSRGERTAADADRDGSQTLGDDGSGMGSVYCEWTPDGYQYENLSDHWRNFPSQSPVCGGDDGLSALLDGITFPRWRRESLKAYGNAIVPQIACRIFRAIDLFERPRT